jgi:glycosyltransferase involved in cell wall biosynthesis
MKENFTKNIWIINQYLTTPELNGNGYRHSYLADIFQDNNYDVTLITSSFSHVPHKDIKINGLFKILNSNIRTILIKGNRFKKSKGLQRILSWFIFSFLLFFLPKSKLPKPDFIIVSSMSIFPVLNVVFYFKRKYPNVKFIFETRDIWPLTIIELGGYSKNNLFVKLLAWIEKLGYEKADHNVSVLINADKHIKSVLNHDNFKFSWISNGYNISKDNVAEEISGYLESKIPKNKFIIGYAGTLGKANAMEYMVEAMQGLNENVCLMILGSGNEKGALKKLDRSDKIIFLDKVPKSQVLPFLKKCDLLYLGWHDSKIYNFGISAQKIFEYMYAGRPILMSGDFEDNPISKANCGFVISAENINEINKAVVEILKLNKIFLDELGTNGKSYLMENFTYNLLAKKYINNVFNKL